MGIIFWQSCGNSGRIGKRLNREIWGIRWVPLRTNFSSRAKFSGSRIIIYKKFINWTTVLKSAKEPSAPSAQQRSGSRLVVVLMARKRKMLGYRAGSVSAITTKRKLRQAARMTIVLSRQAMQMIIALSQKYYWTIVTDLKLKVAGQIYNLNTAPLQPSAHQCTRY